jgi:hypothetical protein
MKILEENFVDILLRSRSRVNIERQLAEMALGIVAGLRDRTITLEQARLDLFNLDIYQAISRHKMNRDLVTLCEWGMELEDVIEIAPQSIEKSCKQIERLAKRVLSRERRKNGRNTRD